MRDAENKFAKLKDEHLLLYDRQKELEKVLERKRLDLAENDSQYKTLFSKHEQYKTIQTIHEEEVRALKDENVKLRDKCEMMKQIKHKTYHKTPEERVNTEEFESRIKELTFKMGKYQTQYIDTKENCMMYLDQLEDLKRENSDLQEQLEKFHSSQEAHTLQIKLFQEKIDELEFEKTEVDSQLSMKDEQIQKYARDNEELREQLQLEIAKYAKYKDVIMMYEDYRNRNKGDLVWMNQQISNKYEQEIADLREELSTRKKKIFELIDEKARIEFERRQLQGELNGINSEISEMRERKVSLQKEIEKLSTDLQDKLKKLNKAIRECSDETERNRALSDMNDGLKRELEEKRIYILTLEAKMVTRSKPERSSHNITGENLNEQIRSLKGKIDEKISVIPTTSDKIKQPGDNKENYSKENSALREEIAKLKKEGTAQQEMIDNLKADLISKIDMLENFKSTAALDKKHLEVEIARLKKEILAKGGVTKEDLEAARKEIDEMSEVIEILKSDIVSKDREIDKLNSLNDAAKEEKKDLESKIDYFRILCNQLSKDIAERNELYENKSEEVTLLTAKMADLQEKLRRFDGIDIQQINNRIKQLETREATLYNVILKIEHAEDSLIASLSCCSCLELLKESVTCVPCGHSYCSKCKEGYEHNCKECERNKGAISSEFFRNKQLDAIATKISYNRLIFESIKEKPSSKAAL